MGEETPVLSGVEAAVSMPDLSAYPWVYLRDGKPLAEDEAVISLLAVGDVMLGRGVLVQPEPLADVAWLGAADLVLGNLEGVVTSEQFTVDSEQSTDPGSRIMLTMPETVVTHLREAGFDLLGLANNHSLDLGAAGLAETAVSLQEAGLTPIGLQTSALVTPTIRVVNGVHLAFFAFNAVPDPEGGALSS
ncbi:MAG: CapA family protein [Chloroflexi bacterium]|nr:CapA family protein [Chloroflexota bacterium]